MIIFCFFSLISLSFEIVSLGIFIPIIDLVIEGREYFTYNEYSISLKTLLISTCLIYTFKLIYGLTYLYNLNWFVYGFEKNLSISLLKDFFSLNYSDQTKLNSSDLKNTIIQETSTFSIIILNQSILVVSEIILTSGLLFFLFIFNAQFALIIGVTLVFFASLFFYITKNLNSRLSEKRVIINSQRLKIVDEIFLSFKEIVIYLKKNFFINKFENLTTEHRKVNSLKNTLIQSPKLIIEFILFGSFSLILLFVINFNTDENIVTTLAVFAIAAVKIVPSFNRIISNLQSIKVYSGSTFKILELKTYFNKCFLKNKNVNNHDQINFNSNIELKNICFNYDKNQILKNINLKINKGEIIGILGESGSGKSTLIDILIGILNQKSGTIKIDGDDVNIYNNKNWISKFGYLSQSFYIINGSISENVAYGIQKDIIENNRVVLALKKAFFNLNKSFNASDFQVAEHGNNLSGGQRQRLALARAFYENKEILILDEATSALDDKTESKILDELKKINKTNGTTIIFITHNVKMLEYADKVIKINE